MQAGKYANGPEFIWISGRFLKQAGLKRRNLPRYLRRHRTAGAPLLQPILKRYEMLIGGKFAASAKTHVACVSRDLGKR
jgi:hypothetical protein